MPITTLDRKLLWARSGGTYAICKSHLTADAKGGDKDVVLGEEAHIVSEKPNGPRFRPMSLKEVDTYANLLLLCPSDHKIVDEQLTYYTEERLHAVKRKHEQWVKDRTAQAAPAIKIRDPEAGKPITLQRITTGKELMNLLAHTLATHHSHPESTSIEEAELIGDFFQNITDCRDIWDEIELREHTMAAFLISEEITQLREAKLVVYAGTRNHVIEGGVKPPAPWPVAYIVIRRSDDESL